MLHRFIGPSFSADVSGYGIADVTIEYDPNMDEVNYHIVLHVGDKRYVGYGTTLRDALRKSIEIYNSRGNNAVD